MQKLKNHKSYSTLLAKQYQNLPLENVNVGHATIRT